MRRRSGSRLDGTDAWRARLARRACAGFAAVILSAAGAAGAARAADADADATSGALGAGRMRALDVRFDNDSFATWPHDDGWYTAGFAASWLSETAGEDGPHARAARLACAWLGCGGGARAWRLGTLTHRLTTPTDTAPSVPQPHDRPYAATLALGTGIVVREPALQHRFEVRAGVLGPAPLGEPVQNGVHRALGVKPANGWDTQVRPRALLQLGWSRLARHGAPGRRVDWVHRFAADLGTVHVGAGVGAMLRAGAPPAGPGWPGEPAGAWAADRVGGAWHVYAGGWLRAIAVDRTIDGRTFGYRTRTEPEPLGGELFVGASAWVSREWRLEATMTLRAVEFDAPEAPRERAQRFATLSVHWDGR
jgi:hypothetical protein